MKFFFVWLDIGDIGRINPHHGLASLAGYLKSLGHEATCAHIRSEGELATLPEIVSANSPDCIGFSLVTNQRKYLDPFVSACRKSFDGLVICGGVHPTLSPDETLQCEGVDGVVIGEGEYPLATLAEKIENNETNRSILSFRWKEKSLNNANVSSCGVQAFERDINKLSTPDYTIFDVDAILDAVGGYLPVIISRGCPYNCTYCCNEAIKSVYPSGRGYFRILNPQHAIDQLKSFKERFPIKGFIFEDDLLIWNKKWFTDFATAYTKEIGLPYICNSRFELVRDKELVTSLKESGCKQVMFGLESGDEEYRKSYLKRAYSNESVYTATRLLRDAGVPFFTYNIMGFPFETEEQMTKTYELNREIRPQSGQVFFFYPYPGTDLYEICKKNDLLKPELMNDVAGYTEKPVIKLTSCTESDCVKVHHKLFTYLLVRKVSKVIHTDKVWVDNLIHKAMLLTPKTMISLILKENILKIALRKILYKSMSNKI